MKVLILRRGLIGADEEVEEEDEEVVVVVEENVGGEGEDSLRGVGTGGIIAFLGPFFSSSVEDHQQQTMIHK